MESQEKVLNSVCFVCKKQLKKSEGFTSNTGIIVCSTICKEQYERNKPPVLTVYSRVTGYCTPVNSWNKGKLQEFKDRKKYSMEKI